MRRLLIAALICTGALQAEAPCLAACEFYGNFEVGVHALVFVPMICEYDYATVAATSGNLPVASATCQLDWGFRLFGRYLSDCSFAHLSYQWYESKVTDSAGAPFTIFRGGFVAQRGTAQLHLEYQNFDVRVGSYLHRSSCYRSFVFGNVRWIDLDYRRTVRPNDGTGNVQRLNEKSDFEGAALGVGAGLELDLPCSFGLFGEANLLGVFAQRSATNVLTDNGGNRAPVKYETDDCISPEMAWRFGLSYTYICGFLEIQGEVGYEFDYFWKAIAFPQRLTEGQQFLEGRFRRCEDVGFSGLFFGLRLAI